MDERASHPSAGPSHDQPHVGHGISPANSACGYSEAGMRRKVTRLTTPRASSPARRLPLSLRVRALDDEEIELGFALAQRGRGLVLGRAVASERRSIARKFEHDGAPTHLALHHLALAAAH